MAIKIKTTNLSDVSKKIKELSLKNIERKFMGNSFRALENLIDPKGNNKSIKK
ncbi:MAG: hypothetical protein ACJZZ8_03600 [Candidatus Neomarinimicrobiota bacterium]|jgi:hypothetical protein|tara:strand:+ start:1668 stop:1826 length:159 start_codon:yes stop_codon:yes gene_type:complete